MRATRTVSDTHFFVEEMRFVSHSQSSSTRIVTCTSTQQQHPNTTMETDTIQTHRRGAYCYGGGGAGNGRNAGNVRPHASRTRWCSQYVPMEKRGEKMGANYRDSSVQILRSRSCIFDLMPSFGGCDRESHPSPNGRRRGATSTQSSAVDIRGWHIVSVWRYCRRANRPRHTSTA